MRRLRFKGNMPHSYETGPLSEGHTVYNDNLSSLHNMNTKQANMSFDLCNKRQLNFLRLQRIIDKIRAPIQEFSINDDDDSQVQRNVNPLSTV